MAKKSRRPLNYHENFRTVHESLRVRRSMLLTPSLKTALRLASLACKPYPGAQVTERKAVTTEAGILARREFIVLAERSRFLNITPIAYIKEGLEEELDATRQEKLEDIHVKGLVVLGSKEFPTIALELDSDSLHAERDTAKNFVEELGEVRILNGFIPHVSLATIRDPSIRPTQIMRRVEAFLPETVSLQPLAINASTNF
jgi:hypothetical protein